MVAAPGGSRLLGDLEDADLRVCLKERSEPADHIAGEQVAGEGVIGLGDGVESVQNLDVLVSDQKILGPGARHISEERLLALAVPGSGR